MNKENKWDTLIKPKTGWFEINFKEIFLKSLGNYDEIILIGSGKGVVSVSEIENTSWKRKNFKIYGRLFKIYNNRIFYS